MYFYIVSFIEKSATIYRWSGSSVRHSIWTKRRHVLEWPNCMVCRLQSSIWPYGSLSSCPLMSLCVKAGVLRMSHSVGVMDRGRAHSTLRRPSTRLCVSHNLWLVSQCLLLYCYLSWFLKSEWKKIVSSIGVGSSFHTNRCSPKMKILYRVYEALSGLQIITQGTFDLSYNGYNCMKHVILTIQKTETT